MNSKRLPGKVLKEYKGISPLKVLIERLIDAKFNINDIIIATTSKRVDRKIINFSKKYNIKFFTGDENDVLGRFYKTAVKFKIQNIIRITSDCLFVDLNILKKIINFINKNNYKLKYQQKIQRNFGWKSSIKKDLEFVKKKI